MQSRVETLERLRALYGRVTEMQGMALEQAAAGVRDAEQRIETQRSRVRQSSAESLRALAAGDKLGWMIFESQRALAGSVTMELVSLGQERERAFESAAELYRENRLQLEQMRSVLQEIQARLERERARREQRESDDRFLSRQRWLERRSSRTA